MDMASIFNRSLGTENPIYIAFTPDAKKYQSDRDYMFSIWSQHPGVMAVIGC